MKVAPTVVDLFAASHEKYHKKELSNWLYTTLKLTSLKMAEGAKIQDHVDDFNDLLVAVENFGENLNYEKKKTVQFFASFIQVYFPCYGVGSL